MTSIRDALNGNVRVANMLSREGIHTMETLCELRRALGEKEFEVRMNDIRNFGKDSMALILDAMEECERNPQLKGEQDESALLGSLPEGIRARLTGTLRHLVKLGATPDLRVIPGVPETFTSFGRTSEGSVTAGDLAALSQFLTGERWDFDLEDNERKEKND